MSQEIAVKSRLPGQRYAFLLERIRDLLRQRGVASVVGRDYCGESMAASLSDELGCYCRYRRDSERYEFRDQPFPQPTREEQQLWRLIR
ncbi:hypothetical protein [Pseudomonas sp. SO81]|uniref:hypothetical protein n=1 Tax=Pseudomonas sp. SO81 TaxID=2983246 RepID=UPI0025A4888F|nr:hypothetical protein [Pseudomonas sp. SO81]WJN61349.1 hypothetical protein OH686_21610 [Pseudomonas sp. SO81]